MKTLYYYLILLFTISIITSCNKEISVPEPTFNISTDQQTYYVDDTINFRFSGNADYITFYSGTEGNAYVNRFRTKVENPVPELQFTSLGRYLQAGNSLSLMISQDFNGKLNTEDLQAATWVDITNRANISTGVDTESGVIDLSDFTDAPVYIAFKWKTTSPLTVGSWWITNFSLRALLPSGMNLPIVSELIEADWVQLDVEGPLRKWRITADDLYIGSNTEADNEDWVITKKINLAAIRPDAGLPIKSLSAPIDGYQYIYKEPGTYTVTFVAANGNVYDRKEVVKEVTITVVERPI